MDAVNLQGVWLNFPSPAVARTRPAQVGGYVRYLMAQASLEESRQAVLRRHFRRLAIRAQEYRMAVKQMETQQRTLAVYSVLFSEL